VALLSDPIINHYTEASGDRAQFGWPLDEEIEKLRMEFVREGDAKKAVRDRREGAEACPRSRRDGAARPVRAAMARRRSVSGNIQSPSRCLERREEIETPQQRLSRTPRNANLAAITTASVGGNNMVKAYLHERRVRAGLTAGLRSAAGDAQAGQALPLAYDQPVSTGYGIAGTISPTSSRKLSKAPC